VKIDTPEVRRISNLALRSGPFALDLRSWSNSIKAGHSPARKPSRPSPQLGVGAVMTSDLPSEHYQVFPLQRNVGQESGQT
jgi:hypothetical protein